MAFLPLSMLLLFSFARYSSAAYCVCNTGMSDTVLQRSIDYACGNGADCSPINQNGPCFNPNTVKDHCNYAVNSYYQKKGQVQGSCDFSGSATVSQTPPSGESHVDLPSYPPQESRFHYSYFFCVCVCFLIAYRCKFCLLF
ncbi:putative carbohydrate-binding X8 domain-containing protein, plant [Helianthus debilis subsp. tardiflorus]